MDIAQNCDSYINIPSWQTCKSDFDSVIPRRNQTEYLQ
jgi:hypothetical protein